MKYLVMECHPAYAVVLDETGRFLQVANQHFTVGQQVDEVICLQEAKDPASTKRLFRNLVAVAACLCLLLAGTWQLFMPYGTVRMQINPDVKVTVNRLNYVIEVTALNADGKALLEGYNPGIQTIDQVLDTLADRARQMGYLTDEGNIQLTVESSHKSWQTATQDRLIAELEVYFGGHILVIPNTNPIPGDDWFDGDDDGYDDDDADNPQVSAPSMTAEAAQALIFRQLGISREQVTALQWEYDDGIYEVEFVYQGMEYEFTVDPKTGTVTETDREPVENDRDD